MGLGGLRNGLPQHPADKPLLPGSYRTTLGGVGAILCGLGALGKCLKDFLDSGTLNIDEIGLALGLVSAGWVGLTARDNKVSSEDVKAK
jgi:hypothetical protein